MKTNETLNSEFVNRVAKEAYKAVRYPSISVFFSWGGERFKATTYKGMAALQFRTHGFLHKGNVIVAYNEGTDYYEVYTLKSTGEVKEQATDVCFDELQSTIDRFVETKNADSDEYRNKCAKAKYRI